MDLIRQEILKKRQSRAEESGGKKFFKRSEMEQKKIQKLREEERRDLELKSQRRAAAASGKASCKSSALADAAAIADSKTLTDEKAILVLPRQEAIRRLRFLKQPMTLFGEDDQARLDRIKYVLKEGLFEEVDSDMTQGQTNDFLRDIAELKKRQKMSSSIMGGDRKRKSRDETRDDDELSSDADKEYLKRLRATNFEDLCDEDKIIMFCKKLLIEWKQELDAMENTQRRTAIGKQMLAIFNQCARDLTPLFNLCRNTGLPADIRQGLIVMVNCCIKRDYLAATAQFIKLAIGNAAWPIGVTMVGIHERSAREKICTNANSVAHIMNNETTRKYLQSVKRLTTFCQRRYPAMPSKSVEFNSLANGSDLQSLLAEERFFGANRE